jgi:hypothetical protein
MPKYVSWWVMACLSHAFAFAQPSAMPKPVPAITTPAQSNITSTTPSTATSTATSTAATRKNANSGEIFRWVDSKGKVQYSAEVPEDRLSTARRVDTRSNIVSSRVPASIAVSPPNPPPAETTASARAPVTEREKCEAAWKKYNEAVACFAQARQGTVRGRGGSGGGNVAAAEAAQCQSLAEPAPCR